MLMIFWDYKFSIIWGVRRWWNPLADDGDAMRLSVDQNIVHTCGETEALAYHYSLSGLWSIQNKVLVVNGDKLAATRQAICKAVIAIKGRNEKV